MANQIVWCDIPVLDLDRAIKFYSAVLGQDVKKQEFPGMMIGVLPHNDGEAGGCLFTSPDEKPSDKGVMIYLNANGRLDDALSAVTLQRRENRPAETSDRSVRFSCDRARLRGQSNRAAFRLDLALRGDSA